MDIKTQEERSRNMAKIKSRDTKPEVYIRSLLHRRGYRFRVAYTSVDGKPDLYFTKRRIAVFIHGCYWHRHTDCRFAYVPKSNTDFWISKFNSNVRRDKVVKDSLLAKNIRVLIIWECTIKRMMKNAEVCENITNQIVSFVEDGKQLYSEL